MNQSIPALDELQRALSHQNAGQRLRGSILGTFGLSALGLVWVATAWEYPFAVLGSLAVSIWFGVFGVLLLRRTVLTAPGLAYGVLGALFLASLALVAVEFVAEPPAPGKLPRTIIAPATIVILGGFLYVRGLSDARQVGPAPQPATLAWLETAFDGPESGAFSLAATGEIIRTRRLPGALLTSNPINKQIGMVARHELGFRPGGAGPRAELIVQGFPQQIDIEPAEAAELERWLRG
ncbi:MAG TPA: hypothetical protein VGE07_24080 [Herpetosiphonaceae bacterium]